MVKQFHTLREELAELLPKNIARTPKILPKGWQLLFEETKTVRLKIPLYPEFAENSGYKGMFSLANILQIDVDKWRWELNIDGGKYGLK